MVMNGPQAQVLKLCTYYSTSRSLSHIHVISVEKQDEPGRKTCLNVGCCVSQLA